MNYAIFKNKNDSNKSFCTVGRIKDVDLRSNLCTIVINGFEKTVKINQLVIDIMSGKGCISNPSALINYNFDKFLGNTKKHKDVLKERKLSKSINDKSSNTVRSNLLHVNKLLYHGSNGGIKGQLSVNANTGVCDFGDGFYTGNNLNQAENRVSNKKDSIIYAYQYNFGNYKVYEFDDIVNWAVYVGYNRHIISVNSSFVLELINKINTYDIVIGYIADDKISAVYNDFLNGNITDVCLAECLKLVKYGNQIVFKTTASLNCLKLYSSYTLTKEMKENSKQWSAHIRSDMDKNIEYCKQKYRRVGRYIDEVIGVSRYE